MHETKISKVNWNYQSCFCLKAGKAPTYSGKLFCNYYK